MKFLIEGGLWFTLPILVMGIVSLILIVLSFVRLSAKKPVARLIPDTILLLGFLGVSWGIFGQITGMFQAAGAIVRAGEIHPSLIWAGFRVSLISVIMGFVVLFVSAVGWYILRFFGVRQ